jgi:hypothetical protein
MYVIRGYYGREPNYLCFPPDKDLYETRITDTLATGLHRTNSPLNYGKSSQGSIQAYSNRQRPRVETSEIAYAEISMVPVRVQLQNKLQLGTGNSRELLIDTLRTRRLRDGVSNTIWKVEAVRYCLIQIQVCNKKQARDAVSGTTVSRIFVGAYLDVSIKVTASSSSFSCCYFSCC